MPVDPTILEQIKAAIRIEEVVGDVVTLKRKGGHQQLWGCCPFHEEKTPSFAVHLSGNFFKCFGCGKGGDAITFLQEAKGMSYLEAMHYLADKYHLPWKVIEKPEIPVDPALEHVYQVLETAQDFFVTQLQDHPAAQHYVLERQWPEELVVRFGLGYAPCAWDKLAAYAKQKGISTQDLLDTGLAAQKEERTYDRFRDRLMFPIHHSTGRIVGFGGRILHPSEREPKYLNSPETKVYQKNQLLYGLYQAKQHIREKRRCFLVEGYTDVLALWQAGEPAVVACAGTALSSSQVTLLKRFTRSVTLLMDGDRAGQKAMLRAIELFLAEGCQVDVIPLPAGEDPASCLVNEGKDGLIKRLRSTAQDGITYFMQQLLEDKEQQDPASRSNAIRSVLHMLQWIPDVIQQGVYVDLCSQWTHIPVSTLQKELAHIAQKKHPSQEPLEVRKSTPPKTKKGAQERALLHILLHHAHHPLEEEIRLGDYMEEELQGLSFVQEEHATIYKTCMEEWKKNKEQPISLERFREQLPSHLQELVMELILFRYSPSQQWEEKILGGTKQEREGLGKVLYKAIIRLKLRALDQLLHEAHKKVINASSPEEEEQALHTYMAVKELQIPMAKALGIVIFPSTGPQS